MAAVIWSCSSCYGSKVDPDFLATTVFGLQVKGNEVFKFDYYSCQTAFNLQKKEFRAHTDTMSDYYCLTLDKLPSSTGDKVKGDLVWTSTSDVSEKEDISFVVKKVERNQMMWLWSRKEGIGVVIQIIE